jgi:hypothetical protein
MVIDSKQKAKNGRKLAENHQYDFLLAHFLKSKATLIVKLE